MSEGGKDAQELMPTQRVYTTSRERRLEEFTLSSLFASFRFVVVPPVPMSGIAARSLASTALAVAPQRMQRRTPTSAVVAAYPRSSECAEVKCMRTRRNFAGVAVVAQRSTGNSSCYAIALT